jgi:hypothetical protein
MRQPKHLRRASAKRRRNGCKGSSLPTSNSSGCLGTDERFRYIEAALQLKVTLRKSLHQSSYRCVSHLLEWGACEAM